MLKRFQPHLPFIVIVILVLIVALPVLSYPMGRDQGMYANIGRTILAGGTPYVDMWDIKPPPIYYIYAAGIAIFGKSIWAIRAIDLSLVPLGMLGLYLLGNRITKRRVGLFAALLFGVFYFNDGFQNISQSDSIATIPLIWIGYFTVRTSNSEAGSRTALISALIVGLLSGVLLWFKPQQYALVVSAFIVSFVIQRFLASPTIETSAFSTQHSALEKIRKLLKEGVTFILGGLLTGGSILIYFWSQGIIQEILIVAEGTAAYNAQGYDFAAFIANMGQGLYFRWTVWHGLFVLSGLWIMWQIWLLFKRSASQNPHNQETLESGRAQRPSPTNSILLILWLIAGLGFAFMQAKGFDTHWFPMLPAMALMGAIVIDRFLQAIRVLTSKSPSLGTGEGDLGGEVKMVIALNAIIVIVLLSIPALTTWGQSWRYIANQQSKYEYWDSFQANDLKPEESLEMANFLRERVQAGNSLFIWGFRPEVYYMADLWSATRYQAQFPLVAPWYPQEWKQNNVDILWAAMPPYALVLEDDFMPWVTDFDADSHTLLQDYTELNNWLIANYERDGQIGDFIIWRRSTP